MQTTTNTAERGNRHSKGSLHGMSHPPLPPFLEMVRRTQCLSDLNLAATCRSEYIVPTKKFVAKTLQVNCILKDYLHHGNGPLAVTTLSKFRQSCNETDTSFKLGSSIDMIAVEAQIENAEVIHRMEIAAGELAPGPVPDNEKEIGSEDELPESLPDEIYGGDMDDKYVPPGHPAQVQSGVSDEQYQAPLLSVNISDALAVAPLTAAL